MEMWHIVADVLNGQHAGTGATFNLANKYEDIVMLEQNWHRGNPRRRQPDTLAAVSPTYLL